MRTHRTGPQLKSKIKSLASLTRIISGLKRQGKRIVFTNGCFDILHYGHAKYLEDARRKGDILVVAVNSDSSVRKIKGPKRPLVSQNFRLGLLAALESVDYVVLFNEETPLASIKKLKPDILVKGADWSKNNIVGGKFVKRLGGKVSTVRLVKGLSTTNLIKKIERTY
jgi:D-beta-D-heptose 7-phosphate kinase/D-beta-D-heptose 1-phosphate adenosyltransferase